MSATSNTTSKLRAKYNAARRSLTVWASASVPVALAAAESLKENLPSLAECLTGWRLVALSVAVSAFIAWARVRGVKDPE